MCSLIDSQMFFTGTFIDAKLKAEKEGKTRNQSQQCLNLKDQSNQEKYKPFQLSSQMALGSNKSTDVAITQIDRFSIAFNNNQKAVKDLFVIQGNILKDQQYFLIMANDQKILFGKQLMRRQKQSKMKILIRPQTGQIKISCPNIHVRHNQKTFANQDQFNSRVKIVIQKKIVELFENYVYPLLKSTVLYKAEQDRAINKQNLIIVNLQKYLCMSSIPNLFLKQKQSYNQVHLNERQTKQDIIKLQSGIDIQYYGFNSELSLFSIQKVKDQIKKVSHYVELEQSEKNQLSLLSESNQDRSLIQNQEQYVLNCIGVLKVENRKKFINCGGSCSVFLIKIIFQYVFSDDPKFWLQQNKRTKKNIIQKNFIVKQPNSLDNLLQKMKIKHEKNIIKLMKGGYSKHIPKYYKIEDFEAKLGMSRNQQNILMDYLNGDTLDVYAQKNRNCLSFWTKLFIMKGIVNGLQFLSSYKIVHLDMKPSNVVVIRDLVAKIIDFGESYHSSLCKQGYVPGISMPYSCPQVFEECATFRQRCDVFSLGIIMFELFLKREPFEINRRTLMSLYKDKSYMKRVLISIEQLKDNSIQPIFQIFLNLILRCLDSDVNKRPTLPWINIIYKKMFSFYRTQK